MSNGDFRFATVPNDTDTSIEAHTESWEEFIKRFSNPPEREEKAGPAFIPAIFKQDKRADANVAVVTALALDFDAKNGRTVSAADIQAKVTGRYVDHTTHSSTPEKVRRRVIIPYARPATPAEHAATYTKMAALFNGALDTSCRNPSHHFYFPAVRPGHLNDYELVVHDGPLLEPLPAVEMPPASMLEDSGPVGQLGENELTDRECKMLERVRSIDVPGDRSKRDFMVACELIALEATDAEVGRVLRAGFWHNKYPNVYGTPRRSYLGHVIANARKEAGTHVEDSLNAGNTKAVAQRRAVPKVAGKVLQRPRTDTGNAERLVDAFADQLRYCPQTEQWMRWDGTRWRWDDDGAAQRAMKAVVRSIYTEAKKHPDEEERVKLGKWAVKSESAGLREAALRLAQTETPLLVNAALLDADPFLLGVRNGVLDLKTFKLLPPQPGQFLTKQAFVEFDPRTRCPLWLAFLDKVFLRDSGLISYVQRAVGYMLTGNVMERAFFFLYGEQTGTGKSTFAGTLQSLLGDYAVKAKSETFMRASFVSNNAPRPDILALRGARMVTASELGDQQRFDEEKLKDMVGGMDTLSERNLHSKHMQVFQPTFKLVLYGNKKPRLRPDDDAVWGRLHMIPFDVVIPPAEQDKTLGDKLRGEFSGILNWALAGCAEWQRLGDLNAPQQVRATGDKYRSSQDLVGQFISDWCALQLENSVYGGDLYNAFQQWSFHNGHHPVSNNRFAEQLERKGYKKDTMSGGKRRWRGIELKPIQERP